MKKIGTKNEKSPNLELHGLHWTALVSTCYFSVLYHRLGLWLLDKISDYITLENCDDNLSVFSDNFEIISSVLLQ